MNHTEKFNKSIDILVKAYLNDTLDAHNCAACAVGNLIAAAKGYNITRQYVYWEDKEGQNVMPTWSTPILFRGYQEAIDTSEGYNQIASTGYSLEEFSNIEEAFMRGVQKPEGNYAGLMAVVDVLASIHNIDLATATASKALFVKA